jgi:hypothetical protein
MASYEFQSMLYRNEREMLDAIAESWITADGANDAEFVADYLDINSDGEIAAECIEEWGLGVVEYGSDRPSHMTEHGYDADNLADAIARYRASQGGRD